MGAIICVEPTVEGQPAHFSEQFSACGSSGALTVLALLILMVYECHFVIMHVLYLQIIVTLIKVFGVWLQHVMTW